MSIFYQINDFGGKHRFASIFPILSLFNNIWLIIFRKPKISKFGQPVLLKNKDIFKFNIIMGNIFFMDVFNSSVYLLEQISDLVGVQNVWVHFAHVVE